MQKLFIGGGGFEGVTTPAPATPEKFNHTLVRVVFVQASNECVMCVSCMYHVCIMYVSCMYHECIRNVS